ncbi:MAG: protein kinase [Elusimicrobia bacterium]|nr:protein kinase [Elusimicrobiota bacterium]
MKIGPVLAFLPLLACVASDAAEIAASIDKKNISLGEKVTLSLTFPSNCTMVPPASDSYKVLSVDSKVTKSQTASKLQSVSSQYSVGNKMQSGGTAPQWFRQSDYVIQPTAAGSVNLGPFPVICPDGANQTPITEVQVQGAPNTAPGGSPAGGSPSPGGGGARQTGTISDDMLFKPVSLGSGGSPQPSEPPPGPPSSQPSAPDRRPEAQPPVAGTTPPPASSPGDPAAPPPAGNSFAVKGAKSQEPDPEAAAAAAAKHAGRVASYVARFASEFGKRVNVAGIVLWLLGLAAAAVGVFALVVGFKRFKKSRAFEELRLWFRQMLPSAGQEGKEGLIAGKYEVITELGVGGMGMVLLAKDTKLARKVALKRLHTDAKFDLRHREKLLQEARIISQLNHPYIVGIHEIVEHDDDIYLVFDYIEGKPLSQIIDDKKRLSVKECVEFFTHVCEAIDFAHKKNVLHLDIKPSNIMVDGNGYAKVMDFGLAHAQTAGDDESSHGVGGSGTLPYMAPEVQEGAPPTSAADIYGLGISIYEALTGQIPFKGPDYIRQKAKMLYSPPSTVVPGIAPAVDQLVADLLAPDPRKRIAGPTQLAQRLKLLLGAGESVKS